MAELLKTFPATNISETAALNISFNVAKVFSKVIVLVKTVSGNCDADLYITTQGEASPDNFEYISLQSGAVEEYNLLNPAQATYNCYIIAWSGQGKCTFEAWGMTGDEPIPEPAPIPVEPPAAPPIDSGIGEVTGAVGNISLTINQDTSAIAQALIGLNSTIESAISGSISGQSDAIKKSLQGISDIHSAELYGVTEGLKYSYGNSANLISTSLKSVGDELYTGIGYVETAITDGLRDSALSIETKLANPLMLKLTDISDSIKGISSGVIDDILLSVFKKV
jgi:hypothetical protein